MIILYSFNFIISLNYASIKFLVKNDLNNGDWGLGIGPNPQSPIPNPQSPIVDCNFNIICFHSKI